MPTPGDLGYLIEHTASMLHKQTDQLLQERLGIGMSQFKLLVVFRNQPELSQRAGRSQKRRR